jgi:hypothetical protein
MSAPVETGQFHYTGAGRGSCGTWTVDRRTQQAMPEEQWVLGFIAGQADLSQGLSPSARLDPLKRVDAEGVFAWMDNYCRDHPLNKIIDAIEDFVLAHQN